MSLIKRGDIWWYRFSFNGKRIQESTKQHNKRVAEDMEAAHRSALARGEVGFRDRKVPTLAEFAPRFLASVETACADKPATVDFYQRMLRQVLADPQVSDLRLDAIEEAVIDGYKQRRGRTTTRLGKPIKVASINRELATLRKLLRLAHEWKVLDRVPRVRLLRGEVGREFVLSKAQEETYLNACPQPLRDVAILMLDTGVRPGEALALETKNVHIEPAKGAKRGYIHIRGGKSKNAKRNLSLTSRANDMLQARLGDGELVFDGFLLTSLDHQHLEVREALGMSADFVVHSLRHTMLTRLGESGADAFTIMRIAGHSSITVSQRYVHPTPEALERAFERFEAHAGTNLVQSPVKSS